jgi:hypothetical protein
MEELENCLKGVSKVVEFGVGFPHEHKQKYQ